MNKYPLREIEDNFYQFTSDAGNLYNLYVRLNYQNNVARWYSFEDEIQVYELFFEVNVLNSISKNDPKIPNTLLHYMEQFLFEDFNRVIFFIAGRDDGRNLQLFKIYEIWFNRYQKVNNNYNLIKMNRVIEHHHEVEAYFTCFYWSSRFELSYVNKAIDLVLSEIYPNFTVREYLF